ncbi:uncharacterized protein [Miscanthus floridulus]|uniref:uncharacterized protein n=1 Tax=Miscanthus floridulus TaxID=154761 RepID=UPI0034583897
MTADGAGPAAPPILVRQCPPGVKARLGQIKPRGRAPGLTHPCPPARAASQPTRPAAGHRPPPAPAPASAHAAPGHSGGPRPRSTRAGRATNLGASRPPAPKTPPPLFDFEQWIDTEIKPKDKE